ncbi:MAG: flagellar basal body P-ring formation chaperone FlgA [Burkholderiaceae bacterium]
MNLATFCALWSRPAAVAAAALALLSAAAQAQAVLAPATIAQSATAPVLLAAAPASAVSSPAASFEAGADWAAVTQRWLDAALQQRDGGATLPLRMEVSVGNLDPRLRLAPCNRVEPYLPAGTRLWGRTRLGLRCAEGSTPWNVFLPVTVKAFGPAWVLTRNVPPGTVLTAADAQEMEIDWAADNSPVVAQPEQWVGQVASRALAAGQPLRQSMVRAPSVFRAGAQVRVTAQGPGFVVAGAGQALSDGGVGQTVRVRMDNGRVISGIVSDSGTVDVRVP